MGLFFDHLAEDTGYRTPTEEEHRRMAERIKKESEEYLKSLKYNVNEELERERDREQPPVDSLEETAYGFIWGDTTVSRIGHVPNRKGKYLEIQTEKGRLLVYITKSGRIQITSLESKDE